MYDLNFWSELSADLQRSHVDVARPQIILAVTQVAGPHGMECQLIHHMAHAATGTFTDDDSRWLQEMKRLSDRGAPAS